VIGTAWSLLPFIVVIPLSILTRQVIPGLLAGLLLGAYMLHPTALGGVAASLTYLVKEVGIPDNVRLIVFLYGFGAFVGLVRVTGGVSGFAAWMETRVKTVKSAFAVTWISALVTFMAPDFRIITIAPVMKHIFERLQVPSTKVAYAIDVTSTPLCAIVPIGTAFVGYMVGLITSSSRHFAASGSAYHLLLQSLPFNFFSVAMLLFGVYQTFFKSQFTAAVVSSPDKLADLRFSTKHQGITQARPRLEVAAQMARVEAAEELTQHHDAKVKGDDVPDAMEQLSERVTPNPWNLILPLCLLLVLTLFFTWLDGHSKSPTLFGALAQANAAKAMLEALLVTLVCSILYYAVQRQPIHRTMYGIIAGGNEMMGVIVLLALVWSVSAVSADLGFSTFTARTIGNLVPPAFIAPVLFVFGCAISYVIGSSFGTWGMLLPLGFSLAASTHASLALVAGAVFASGTFGGFVSPLSDNTVAMATVMKLPIMSYARYKLRSALPVAAVCTAGYALAGWFLPA